MEHDELSKKIDQLVESAEKKLSRRSTAGPGPGRGEAIEELKILVEEIRVIGHELKRQADELIVQRQAYKELFDFCPDAYLVTDENGVIKEANKAAKQLLQVPGDFIIGKPLAQFVAKDQQENFFQQLSGLRTGGMEKSENWELPMQVRGGESLHASITVAAVRDPFSRPIGLRWMIRVVTSPTAQSPLQRITSRKISPTGH